MSNWEKFTAPNLGLLFYKQIYRESDIKRKIAFKDGALVIDIPKSEKNSPFNAFYKDLYQKEIGTFHQVQQLPSNQDFSLTTIYPGLLVGSGYPHDTAALGDFKIGFYFDHTTGLPVIPGSSVKGVLRHAFEVDVNDKGKNYTGEKSLAFIQWLLTKIELDTLANQLTVDALRKIKKGIFGDNDTPGRDVFFDAQINIKQTGRKKFLANDFITPHINREKPELSPFTNPVPIQFLKVLPGVAFTFRFKLHDTNIDNITLTAENKKLLFKQILLTLGIGAKTNVGYGQFTDAGIENILPNTISNRAVKKFKESDIPATLPSLNDLKKRNKKTGEPGTLIFGEIVDITPSQKTITILLKIKEKFSHTISNIDTSLFQKKDIVQLEYRGKSGPNHQFKLIN